MFNVFLYDINGFMRQEGYNISKHPTTFLHFSAGFISIIVNNKTEKSQSFHIFYFWLRTYFENATVRSPAVNITSENKIKEAGIRFVRAKIYGFS